MLFKLNLVDIWLSELFFASWEMKIKIAPREETQPDLLCKLCGFLLTCCGAYVPNPKDCITFPLVRVKLKLFAIVNF